MHISDLQLGIIQFFITSIFFYIEALIHFNIGKYGKIGFVIPSLKNNIKIAGIISFFSFVSSVTTYYVEQYIRHSL